MLADNPKELLSEVTRVRDQVAAEAAEPMQHWRSMLARDEFRASAETSRIIWRCGTSICGRRRPRWRPGGWPCWDDARAG